MSSIAKSRTTQFQLDLEAAKALSSSPAALDLFTWLSYRCFTAKGRERVPLSSECLVLSVNSEELNTRAHESFVRNLRAG